MSVNPQRINNKSIIEKRLHWLCATIKDSDQSVQIGSVLSFSLFAAELKQYHVYLVIRRGFPLSRVTTNN